MSNLNMCAVYCMNMESHVKKKWKSPSITFVRCSIIHFSFNIVEFLFDVVHCTVTPNLHLMVQEQITNLKSKPNTDNLYKGQGMVLFCVVLTESSRLYRKQLSFPEKWESSCRKKFKVWHIVVKGDMCLKLLLWSDFMDSIASLSAISLIC